MDAAFSLDDVAQECGGVPCTPAARGDATALDSAFEMLLDELRATADYTFDCIFVLDRAWRFRLLNRRAEQEIAQGRDLIGSVIWDAFPGAREGDFGAPYMRAMIDGVPRSFEAHYPPLGGWYEVQTFAVSGGLLVSFRNINERREAEQRLRQAEERYRLAARATGDLIWDLDIDDDKISWSEASGPRFGYTTEQLGVTAWWWKERIHPDDRSRVIAELADVIGHCRGRFDCRYRWRKADDSFAEVHDRGYLMKDQFGEPIRMVGAMQDITGERAAQAEAARARTLLQTVIDSVPDHIFVKDKTGRFVLTNKASESHWGLLGRRAVDVLPAEVAAALDRIDREVIASNEAHTVEEAAPLNGEMRVFQSVKVPWWQDGEIKGVIGISRDITEQKSVEDRVRWTANHDALTMLPNRRFFQTRLSELICQAKEGSREVALLHVDIDHFKIVNDTLGHDAGDALLNEVADRLRSSVRSTDLVARLGGDEFAVILAGCGTREMGKVSEEILQALRFPFIHETRVTDCRASIGASIFPRHGATPDELLKSADIALYAAKSTGRGVCRLFEASMRDDLQKRTSMLSLGRDALLGRRVFPYYQPKVCLRTGAVTGFEALMRWRHPGRGIQLPGLIAACFEDLDLAAEISDCIIDHVVSDMRGWLDQGIEFGSVAVNAAAAEFRRGDFAEGVLEALARSGVPTRCFQLEVTETVFLGRGAECVEKALKLLSSAGVKIALDDFGTGYASLRHLRQFPVDIIKIDQSFIREMHERQQDAEIVRAVVNLGQSLGMDVVAEGIERADQELELRSMGCGFGQGFLYSEAFAGSEMAVFLRRRGAEPARVSM